MVGEALQGDPDGLPEVFQTATSDALDAGVIPNQLVQGVRDEAGARSAAEGEATRLRIQAELKTYIDSHKVRLSTPQDFEDLRAKERSKWGDASYAEDQVDHTFSFWEEAPAAKAFLSSDDPNQLLMLYKGSDGQLYSVAFDLRDFLMNGERVGRNQLHAYLNEYSPFITVVDLRDLHGYPSGSGNDRGFIEFVQKLHVVCRERFHRESAAARKRTRESLVDSFEI